MKKIKIFLTLFFVLLVTICTNNVYGYQLKYKAHVAEDGSTRYALVRSIGGSASYTTPYNQWHPTGEEDSCNIGYGTASYETYKIVFHTNYLSNYSTNSSKGTLVGYNSSKSFIDITSDATYSNVVLANVNSTQPIYVSSNSNSPVLQYERKKDSSSKDFYLYRIAYSQGEEKFPGTGEYYYNTITDWYISNKVLTELKSHLDSNNRIYFSLPAKTGCWSNPYQWGGPWEINTAYEASQAINVDVYQPRDIGWKDSASFGDGSRYPTSIMSLFDNQLEIKIEDEKPRNVYVRHVDENGNLLKIEDESGNIVNIRNNYAKVTDSSGNSSLLNNTISSTTHSDTANEHYKIDTSQTLTVSRYLNIVENGVQYKYNKVTVARASTYSRALNKVASEIVGAPNEINIEPIEPKEEDVTIVTFVYSKEDINPPDIPIGKFETLDSKEEISGCQMSYTPTGADIKPYLIANKFKLKDLSYELVQNGDRVEYKLKAFNVNKLISGSIDNNTDNEPDRGRIFGEEEEKWTLLKGTGPQDLPIINSNIDSKLNNFKSTYNNKLPMQSQLDDFDNNKTTKDNFERTFTIPENRYNGLRIPKLSANYQEYNVLNETLKANSVTKDSTSNISKILVYNPITVVAPTVTSSGVVDHSTTTHNSVIQKNADFELTINPSGNITYDSDHPDSMYLDNYYLIFDIDIIQTEETDYVGLYENGNFDSLVDNKSPGYVIKKGTLIQLKKDTTSFKAKASNGSDEGDTITQSETNITLIGVSNNMPSDLLRNAVLSAESNNLIEIGSNQVETFISETNNSQVKINGQQKSVIINYCDLAPNDDISNYIVHDKAYYESHTMYGDTYYFAKAVMKATNIGRIYDFKVTDCSDIDYKSVFRKTSGTNVNESTGIQYFSGIKELKIYTNEVNTLEERDNISISGTGAKTIIPLGPYKSTTTSYVSAPKLGYRISFDLKTSGVYNPIQTSQTAQTPTREIKIKPSYYYISKDGTNFVKDITLYYKKSSGKYVNFKDSNYTIYFKPNDGYRTLYNSGYSETPTMSTQLEPLVIGSNEGFTLNSKMMSCADNNFIQAWYGEFKLPNSTIATKGSISDQLTDGYIGVKFEIECIDNKGKSNEKTISYNAENKNADPKTNTTQWDYEGFLGFSNPGNNAENLTLQLEKGTWNINNDIYEKIKGTVVLFDTDNRAANDFD